MCTKTSVFSAKFDAHIMTLFMKKLFTAPLQVPNETHPGSRGDFGGSEERSEGEEKSPLVESVGNLTSMLSPSTEIEPRR